MKIVINYNYGGFGLSDEELKIIGAEWAHEVLRNDPKLIKIVEESGQKAGGPLSSLKVVEIPDGVNWVLEEYDGAEWVAEAHRTWR